MHKETAPQDAANLRPQSKDAGRYGLPAVESEQPLPKGAGCCKLFKASSEQSLPEGADRYKPFELRTTESEQAAARRHRPLPALPTPGPIYSEQPHPRLSRPLQLSSPQPFILAPAGNVTLHDVEDVGVEERGGESRSPRCVILVSPDVGARSGHRERKCPPTLPTTSSTSSTPLGLEDSRLCIQNFAKLTGQPSSQLIQATVTSQVPSKTVAKESCESCYCDLLPLPGADASHTVDSVSGSPRAALQTASGPAFSVSIRIWRLQTTHIASSATRTTPEIFNDPESSTDRISTAAPEFSTDSFRRETARQCFHSLTRFSTWRVDLQTRAVNYDAGTNGYWAVEDCTMPVSMIESQLVNGWDEVHSARELLISGIGMDLTFESTDTDPRHLKSLPRRRSSNCGFKTFVQRRPPCSCLELTPSRRLGRWIEGRLDYTSGTIFLVPVSLTLYHRLQPWAWTRGGSDRQRLEVFDFEVFTSSLEVLLKSFDCVGTRTFIQIDGSALDSTWSEVKVVREAVTWGRGVHTGKASNVSGEGEPMALGMQWVVLRGGRSQRRRDGRPMVWKKDCQRGLGKAAPGGRFVGRVRDESRGLCRLVKTSDVSVSQGFKAILQHRLFPPKDTNPALAKPGFDGTAFFGVVRESTKIRVTPFTGSYAPQRTRRKSNSSGSSYQQEDSEHLEEMPPVTVRRSLRATGGGPDHHYSPRASRCDALSQTELPLDLLSSPSKRPGPRLGSNAMLVAFARKPPDFAAHIVDIIQKVVGEASHQTAVRRSGKAWRSFDGADVMEK
ncbi:hypothetical protein R3P38DRAFT_2784328 [Favolaschia claudopus]|uniref:Uncharacterized protein n=1 Tax=Favolaschia claudopus TaxID=2862362 RepID=A0AAW0AZ07_9AGAR